MELVGNSTKGRQAFFRLRSAVREGVTANMGLFLNRGSGLCASLSLTGLWQSQWVPKWLSVKFLFFAVHQTHYQHKQESWGWEGGGGPANWQRHGESWWHQERREQSQRSSPSPGLLLLESCVNITVKGPPAGQTPGDVLIANMRLYDFCFSGNWGSFNGEKFWLSESMNRSLKQIYFYINWVLMPFFIIILELNVTGRLWWINRCNFIQFESTLLS